MTYEWPGTEAEKKVARILVGQTGGHFVSIVTVNGGSRVVGTERLGVKVGKHTIDVKAICDALASTGGEHHAE
jgi:hypothetical protein